MSAALSSKFLSGKRHLIGRTKHEVLVVDKLTYAGNLASLVEVQDHPRYRFSPREKFIGASYQRVTEMLAEMFHPGRCTFGHEGTGWERWLAG